MRTAFSRMLTSLQGLSGDSLALLLALGLVLGTFPVYGASTVLCLLAALAFRMNAPALQVVNQLTSPLQLALLFPFSKLGERILGGSHQPQNLASRFSEFTLHSIAGWLCLSLPLGLVLYLALAFALRHYGRGSFGECENLA